MGEAQRAVAECVEVASYDGGLDTGAGDAIVTLHGYIREEGRDVNDVGIEGSVAVAGSTPEGCARQATEWEGLGVSHISVNTASARFTSVDQHVDSLRRFKDTL
mgnify:CR=1 FL=1